MIIFDLQAFTFNSNIRSLVNKELDYINVPDR